MKKFNVELNLIPPALRRLALTWYRWQEITERKRNKAALMHPEDPLRQEYWKYYPPQMRSAHEFRIGDDDFSYYLVSSEGLFYVDIAQRSARSRNCMFRSFYDAEKYLLFKIADSARLVNGLGYLSALWYQQGLNPRVTLKNLEPNEKYPNKFSLTVDQEPVDRGWMDEMDATAFSHAIFLTYEELDARLREGVPPEWFTLELVEA
ncbi:hypothetical protein [Mycobacterium sp.]|uniref:hypothetical protein n=1 Tax=Mycobacterium sp. TaxID=1785 RepID=UPI0031CFC767